MSEEIKYYYLKNHPLFSTLSEQQMKSVCAVVKVKTVFRGELISYGEGSYSRIYFLIKGKVKLTESDEMDNELVKDILTEGEIFGDLSLEGFAVTDELAEALTANTIICYFSVADFKSVLEENPLLALNYAKKVSNKLRRLEGRHADLVFRDAENLPRQTAERIDGESYQRDALGQTTQGGKVLLALYAQVQSQGAGSLVHLAGQKGGVRAEPGPDHVHRDPRVAVVGNRVDKDAEGVVRHRYVADRRTVDGDGQPKRVARLQIRSGNRSVEVARGQLR